MNTIIVFDFETSTAEPETCHPLQIAATVVDAEDDDLPIMDNGVFVSYMRPPISDEDIMNPEIIKDIALKKNHIKREDILEFPDEKIVWSNFVDFCTAFKRGGELPVPCGWNIINFDLPIVKRLSERYKTKRFFHENTSLDLMNLDWIFRQRDPNYAGRSFDMTRLHFGMTLQDGESAHEASTDTRQCTELLRRYLQFIWRSARRNKYFKGAFNEE